MVSKKVFKCLKYLLFYKVEKAAFGGHFIGFLCARGNLESTKKTIENWLKILAKPRETGTA